MDEGASSVSSRERHRRRKEALAKRKINLELDNQSFFFLVKHHVCPNDDNSRYDQVTNRMYLVYQNGRRMVNGVILGKLMHAMRPEIISTPGREDFPVLDPVLGNLVDSLKGDVVRFNWGIIQRELRKYGAEISQTVKDNVIQTQNHEVIREILRYLMEFEKRC
jgi:hypothetical protein